MASISAAFVSALLDAFSLPLSPSLSTGSSTTFAFLKPVPFAAPPPSTTPSLSASASP
eukprot:CAMPEP_0169441742 /NCGR_PEP_ID=MMETSP1042-20121227/8440_1 /TAXON_ID=464988 /ORGANISM="Hemiselmis andersenii, Strain CCMP1180" /LENGTH=57 /DNA_ID=CAMNT_0009552835 /DNA_START=316 /DNA_END=486 /DNA_ORIENTATION=+